VLFTVIKHRVVYIFEAALNIFSYYCYSSCWPVVTSHHKWTHGGDATGHYALVTTAIFGFCLTCRLCHG